MVAVSLILVALAVAPENEAPPPKAAKASSKTEKVREGSLLQRNKPWEEVPDLRSGEEKFRDSEVAKHYERTAKLDVLAQIASEHGDTALQERIDQIRRKEQARFQLAMIRLHETWLRQRLASAP